MTQANEVNVPAKKKTTKPESKPAADFRRLPPADPYEMTDEEIRLQMARDNLATYGSTIAPAAPVRAAEPDAKATRARLEKEIEADEGRRLAVAARAAQAKLRAQSEERLFAAPKKPRAVSPKWFAIQKRCPHCGKVKHIMPDFGVVLRRGIEQAAGWCRQCRSETDYRKRPRTYKVKE